MRLDADEIIEVLVSNEWPFHGTARLTREQAASINISGIGTMTVRWLTSHLFSTYPLLTRIEATTRHDNAAMQMVFDRCGYRQEGRLVEAWVSADGARSDTLIYAILRRERPQATDGLCNADLRGRGVRRAMTPGTAAPSDPWADWRHASSR